MRGFWVLGVVVALGGCVAAWGQSYKVDFQSSSSITIDFDPTISSMGEMQTVAQKHCAEYGKDAIPQGSQTSMWGMESISFLCSARK